ncbi:hypothetical protein [Streptomyces olivoreticuli]|uniref:hypothetical protein n=1 Tax=Streptomyces olivoreticuli TaxID=68246 RepID=UPI000E22438A|nr:hypothetical protein [Streptomyces olivoreticuli]
MTTRQLDRVTRYDRRMVQIMNNPAGRPLYATAARRRGLVAAHIALTAALLAVLLGGIAERLPWLILGGVVVLLPLWCFATGAINGCTRGLLELRARMLDERQLADRHRVQARAHRLSVAGLFGAVVALGAIGAVQGEFRSAALLPVLVVVLVTLWLMPLWTAGLTARDEMTDDVAGL